MKKFIGITALIYTTTLLSSCAVVEGIFKAGVWAGVLSVFIVVVLLFWLFSKLFGGRKE